MAWVLRAHGVWAPREAVPDRDLRAVITLPLIFPGYPYLSAIVHHCALMVIVLPAPTVSIPADMFAFPMLILIFFVTAIAVPAIVNLFLMTNLFGPRDNAWSLGT